MIGPNTHWRPGERAAMEWAFDWMKTHRCQRTYHDDPEALGCATLPPEMFWDLWAAQGRVEVYRFRYDAPGRLVVTDDIRVSNWRTVNPRLALDRDHLYVGGCVVLRGGSRRTSGRV